MIGHCWSVQLALKAFRPPLCAPSLSPWLLDFLEAWCLGLKKEHSRRQEIEASELILSSPRFETLRMSLLVKDSQGQPRVRERENNLYL